MQKGSGLLLSVLIAHLILLSQSCSDDSTSMVLGSESVSVDTTLVSLPANVSSSLIFPHTFFKEGEEHVMFYDHFDHGLVIVNISEREFVKRISLTRDGPNFVESVGAMAVLSNNRIAIAGMNFITVIDFEGKVRRRFSINSDRNDLSGLDFDLYQLEYNQYTGLQYDQYTETLLFNVNPIVRSKPQKYTGIKAAELSLKDEVIRLLPVNIPKVYQSLDGDYGDLVKAGVIRHKDGLVYNYPLSSKVFVSRVRKTESFDLDSKWSENLAAPIKDFSQGADLARYLHKTKEVNYFPLIYDKYRGLYYRMHKSSVQNLEEKPRFYLTVADDRFTKLAELPFAEGYYIFPIVLQDGLMFSAINMHDDQLELIRYNFGL